MLHLVLPHDQIMRNLSNNFNSLEKLGTFGGTHKTIFGKINLVKDLDFLIRSYPLYGEVKTTVLKLPEQLIKYHSMLNVRGSQLKNWWRGSFSGHLRFTDKSLFSVSHNNVAGNIEFQMVSRLCGLENPDIPKLSQPSVFRKIRREPPWCIIAMSLIHS